MEAFVSTSLMAVATGSAAGLRPYLTVFFLGMAKLFTPASAPAMITDVVAIIPDTLTNTWVLVITGVIALCEFLVDKFQFLDSAWDVMQGVVRPVSGAVVGMQIGADAGTEAAIAGAVLGGASAGAVSLGKTVLRAVINLFPEPISNFLTSLGEDVAAIVILISIIFLPIVAAILALGLVILAVFIFRKLRTKFGNPKKKAKEYREARTERHNMPSAGLSIRSLFG